MRVAALALHALFCRHGVTPRPHCRSGPLPAVGGGVNGPTGRNATPSEIPSLLMTALANNDSPTYDNGLRVMWEYSGDTTRWIFKNNRTEFVESAHETAAQFATSFYGAALNGRQWTLEGPLNRVGGADGWIATQVMRTVSADGRARRWQWELRRQRRPPGMGTWYVESIGSSDREGNFDPE